MKFCVAPKQFPEKATPFSVSNFMVNVGAEIMLMKLMTETGIQANVSQQSTTNSNHVTTIQTRRVLELHMLIMSTKSLGQVNRKSNGYSLKMILD